MSSLRTFRVGVVALMVSAGVVVCAAGAARGDELKLKDGSKVIGTIVGFEENSFKVKTSFGFAVVMKDQVVSITMSDPAKAGAAVPAAAKNEAAKVAPPPATPAKQEATEAATTVAPVSAPASAPVAVATNTAAAAPAPTPAVAKPKPATPEPIRETVVGNTYTNDTYGFQMYKPPTWKVIEGARTILPGSITAMGNDDQTTYLMIGQDASGKSFASDVDATDRRLRDILQNFRPIDDKHVTVAGLPAVERHFRGSVDDKDWSGVVVYFTKDAHVYTIFGMTLADTDLVQIQENVIARAISSIQFVK